MASAVTSSADLLPGKAWAQTWQDPGSRAQVPPPHTHRHTLQPPMGQRQINRKDASAAIEALAQRELLPLSTARTIKGSLLKLKKSTLWSLILQ